MVESKTLGDRLIVLLLYTLLAVLALFCLLPMLNLLAVSVSNRAASSGNLVTFWPIGFNLTSYMQVMSSSAFMRAFWVSVERVALGTTINVGLIVLTAYPLSRNAEEFKGRTIFMWLLIFAMLFSGGLIPWFLNIRDLGLLDKMWGLVLHGALQIWSVILAMNFFREIPTELEEAAIIDGANHWDLLARIYLPLSLPVLATVTLFAMVYHWNSWFDGMVLINKSDLIPLQTYMRRIVIEGNLTAFMQRVDSDAADFFNFSDRSLKAAQIFIATLPILIVYPFLQKYFIHGIRLGALKG
jgi:multiple sugar transport system permease protein/putative aldouronate transport system permease protein